MSDKPESTMITARQREALFRDALRKLLDEHKASMEITDDGRPYGMASPLVRITMMGEFDDDGNLVKDFCSFEMK